MIIMQKRPTKCLRLFFNETHIAVQESNNLNLHGCNKLIESFNQETKATYNTEISYFS